MTYRENSSGFNQADDTLYVLTAAASNSHYFLDELYGVLAAAGIRARVCNLMKSSTGILPFHRYWKNAERVFRVYVHDEKGKCVLENMDLDSALKLYPWNVFNMQEGTGPHRKMSPEEAAAERRIAHGELVSHVRNMLPEAKLYYQQIWSYDIGFDRFGYQMTSRAQQLDFSDRIRRYTKLVCDEFDLETIPCGDAWDLAREHSIAQNMCARLSVNHGEGDYYHDGDVGGGQLLNAYVWFETLTGLSCLGNSFRPSYSDVRGTYSLSEELVLLLQDAAHRAVQARK